MSTPARRLGNVGPFRFYWAASAPGPYHRFAKPGLYIWFAKPGLYIWTGKRNLRLVPFRKKRW